MRIAIIETGKPPLAIRDRFKSYPEMFADLLNRTKQDFAISQIRLIDGEPAPNPLEFDGYLITGSPAGVYEDHPWMSELMNFIRDGAALSRPQIGVCFGHQAIAQALGGEVIKSPKGWGLGRHTYDIAHQPDWMPQNAETFSLGVSHQDQVVAVPENTQLLAHSEFTPFAALFYPDAPALSFQGHPEFDNSFCSALYDIRRNNPLSDTEVDSAINTLDQPHHNDLVGEWMACFYQYFTPA